MSRVRLNKNGNPFEKQDAEISVEVMQTITSLSKTGIKVLNHMMSSCGKDEVKVYVDKDEVMFECDLKYKSFFNGVKDLVSKNIIATSDKSFEYYFNHAYFGEQNK